MDFMYVYTCPYSISTELHARYVQDTIHINAFFHIYNNYAKQKK